MWGAEFRFEKATDSDVQKVKKGEEKPRQDGRGKQLAHGQRRLACHDHQHDARRYQDSQGSAGANRTVGHLLVIAVRSHHGHRQKPHGVHRGANDAGAGGEDRRHNDHGQEDAAPHLSKNVAQGFEKVVRDSRLIQKLRHENEELYGQKNVVVHRSPDPVHEHVKHRGAPADQSENYRQSAQDKGKRMPHEQADKKARKHQNRYQFRAHIDHRSPPWRMTILLMTSDIP
jgi:hypothetical protein